MPTCFYLEKINPIVINRIEGFLINNKSYFENFKTNFCYTQNGTYFLNPTNTTHYINFIKKYAK